MAANSVPLRLLLKSKLRVKVHRAQGLVSKHKQGFNSTSVRLKIGEKVQETEVAEKQRAPVWAQSFDFLVPDQDSHLQVTAYHQRRLKKDFLGRVRVPMKDIISLHTSTKSSSKETVGYLLRNKSNLFDKDRGEVYLSFDFVPIDFSVPSDPSSSHGKSFAYGAGSKKEDLLTSDTPLAYSSLTRSKSLRVKSRSRPNLSSRDLTKQSFDWTEARVLKKESLARKAKYQEDEKWPNSDSETSASAVDSSTLPNSYSDSEFGGEGSLSEFSDYAPTSEMTSGVKNRRLECLDFVPQPLLQRGSPDGSCCSIKPKEQLLGSVSNEKLEPTLSREGFKFSPLLASSKKLSRSTSAISVRAPSKTSQAILKPATAKLTADQTEASSPPQLARVSTPPLQDAPASSTQSAVITGRRSERKISRKASSSFNKEGAQLLTPRQEVSTDSFTYPPTAPSPADTSDLTPLQGSKQSPVNPLLRSADGKLCKAEDSSSEDSDPAWNLSSFSSEDAETATELRKNSKQNLIHMLLKQKQEFGLLQRDQLETKRYLDELLSKIIIHCPDLLSKN